MAQQEAPYQWAPLLARKFPAVTPGPGKSLTLLDQALQVSRLLYTDADTLGTIGINLASVAQGLWVSVITLH